MIKVHNLVKDHTINNSLVDVEDLNFSKLMKLKDGDIDIFLSKKEDKLEFSTLKELFNITNEKDIFPAKIL